MGVVKFALKFPSTFVVLAILIVFLGGSASVTMPKDVFPDINIPVISIIWTYTGLSTPEMESRVTTYTEYALSNFVNDIGNIESQTLTGVTVEKVYFQTSVSIDLALAQVVASTQAIRPFLPPGINPPIVVKYSASSVPVVQLSLSSDTMSEAELYDYGQYQARQAITSVPGSILPSPFGGKPRQIMVDLDLHALQALGITPTDVANAVNAENLTAPSGQAKIGITQYQVRLNSSPLTVALLNKTPIKVVNGTTIYLHDIAQVRDGAPVQQNIVRADGRRSVLLTVLKNGGASTLTVVNNIKNGILPALRAAAPTGLKITSLFDQSVFVSTAISELLREGAIAAGLTGLTIFIFLGSWRSTVVVLVSIPLAILASLILLSALGETINIMTLGGLALAVGILVDDATVAIENTYQCLERGLPLRRAVIDGVSGIAKPILVSTLVICAAFVSVMFLNGAAKFLFTPQALAVVFAMLAAYVLSLTLVPILINGLLRSERHPHEDDRPKGLIARFTHWFNKRFERFRGGYIRLLTRLLQRRLIVPAIGGSILLGSAILAMFVGKDYFPAVDAGEMQLHVRGRSGLRIEETERLFQQVEDLIRKAVPDRDRGLILDNIGLPANNYNLAFGDGSQVALNDGQILVSLKPDHAPTAYYQRKLRVELRAAFPDTTFYFQPADMITQVLNFGLPSPIDIQVAGRDAAHNLTVARQIETALSTVHGAVDVHLHQIVDAPELFVDVDRTRALELGLTEQVVTTNLNTSLSSNFQISPNFWLDPNNGIPYPLAVQTPEYRVNTLSELENTPLLGGSKPENVDGSTLLTNVAKLQRGIQQTVVTHSNVQPTYDIYANVQDRDLGGVAEDVARIVAKYRPELKPGNTIAVKGQIGSMNSAFQRIALGLGFAAVFIYLLMVLNFQTWIDPLVVLCALPLTVCGTTVVLFATGTTFSIPSLMGAIMAVGVASANSILLVSYAHEQQLLGRSAIEAAIAAGHARLRPVLMTAGAMIVGLVPMSLGLSDGSEQNAALGRAVIGGLVLGTCTTLLVVPYLYTFFRWLRPVKMPSGDVEAAI